MAFWRKTLIRRDILKNNNYRMPLIGNYILHRIIRINWAMNVSCIIGFCRELRMLAIQLFDEGLTEDQTLNGIKEYLTRRVCLRMLMVNRTPYWYPCFCCFPFNHYPAVWIKETILRKFNLILLHLSRGA